jgi:hypothetical protein
VENEGTIYTYTSVPSVELDQAVADYANESSAREQVRA